MSDSDDNVVRLFLEKAGFGSAWPKFQAEGLTDPEVIQKRTRAQLESLFNTPADATEFAKQWTEFWKEVDKRRNNNASNTSSNVNDIYAAPSFLLTQVGVEDIRKIIEEDYWTKKILEYNERTGLLDGACRDRVIRRIVGACFKIAVEGWSYPHYQKIAESVCTIFRGEEIGTWYEAPISKQQSKEDQSTGAKGKVADGFKNGHSFVRKLEGTVKKRKREDDGEESPGNRKEVRVADEDSTEVNDALDWLKKNYAPMAEVEPRWILTRAHRRKLLLQNKCLDVDTAIKLWPILNYPIAGPLIKLDFANLGKTTLELTEARWDKFFSIILKEKSNIFTRDTVGHELKERLKDLELSKDARVVTQLSLLPHLIKKKKLSANEKYCPVEAKKSLIHVVGSEGDVAAVQEERIKALGRLIVQPYIVVIAADPKNPTNFYVSLKDQKYPVESALDALDLCFKFYHVLDGHYPRATYNIWYLVQRALYQFKDGNEVSVPTLTTLVTMIKKSLDSIRESSIS